MLKTLKAEQIRILGLLPETDPTTDSYTTLLNSLDRICYTLNCYSDPEAKRYGSMQTDPVGVVGDIITAPAEETASTASDEKTELDEKFDQFVQSVVDTAEQSEIPPMTFEECKAFLGEMRLKEGFNINPFVADACAEAGVGKFSEIKDEKIYGKLAHRVRESFRVSGGVA